MTAIAVPSEDTTVTEQIESIYARMGLATAQDRAQFLVGVNQPARVALDVVISTNSQPFD